MSTNNIPMQYRPNNDFLKKIAKCQRCVNAVHTGGSYDDGTKRFCKVWNSQLWIISDRLDGCPEFIEEESI